MDSSIATAPEMIVAANVGKRFSGERPGIGELHALNEIDLTVRAGEFVSLVGPSGCGKSTLLRLVAGLSSPTSGEITVGGRTPESGRQDVALAYVLQDPTLLPWRRVEDNVALPLELRGMPAAERRQRISEALNMVGLSDAAHLSPRQLSGGMRMRVSIARALAISPSLLLMDEPFGALDELSRLRLNEDLLALWEKNRWTCLFVTHNVGEAVFLSQRVVVMSPRPGRFLGEELVSFPHPRTRSLRGQVEFARSVQRVSEKLASGFR